MSDIRFTPQQNRTPPDPTDTEPFEVIEKTDLMTMLEFITSNGIRESFAYATLWGVKLIPDEGIEINFTGVEVLISGSHLDRLYEHIRDRKVISIRQSQRLDEIQMDSTPKTFIKKIDITYISNS